jgi:hypothetical protein
MKKFVVVLMALASPLFAQINNPGGGGGSACGSPTCTVSTAGGGNGVLALSGNTSGTATLTAPAVAGTITNSVVSSNAISVPNGTGCGAPTLNGGGANNPGFSFNSGGIIYISLNTSVCHYLWQLSGSLWGSALPFGWSSTANPAASAQDTGFSREAAGVISADSTAGGNELGLFRTALACRITAAVTLSTAATTICSWSLPASAKIWAWQCSGTYNITAGTSPEFAIGLNASQTPTSETGNAAIYSTGSANGSPSATAVFATGSNTFTTSGNNVLFTPTAVITTVTNAPWTSSGTIQASGTAGTFAITGILTGTTPAGTVSVGSTCELY